MTHQHRETRLRMRARVHVDGPDRFFLGLSENISSGGVFIESLCPPNVGDQIALVVGPESRPLRVDGVVRWHRIDHEGNLTGCGVQFQDLDVPRRRKIQEFIAEAPNDPLLWSTVDEPL